MPPLFIDRSFLRELREEMQQALELVAGRHGVAIEVGSASFTPDSATFKVQVAVKDAGGQALTDEAQVFKAMAPRVGLAAEDLGRGFVYGGEKYTIRGWLRNSRKYPILVERADGRRVKMPVEAVIGSLAAEKAARVNPWKAGE